MYRASLPITLSILFLLSSQGVATETNRREASRPKVRRACDSLRIMLRTNPALRSRAKTALLEKRKVEQTCREAYEKLLPGHDVVPTKGSICHSLKLHEPKTAAINEALKKAQLIDRRADMRCARVISHLKAPKNRPKLGGGQ